MFPSLFPSLSISPLPLSPSLLPVLQDDGMVFLNDNPMVVLMEYMRITNLRLVDLFTSLDKDGSWSLSRDEFKEGLMVSIIVKFNNKPCKTRSLIIDRNENRRTLDLNINP